MPAGPTALTLLLGAAAMACAVLVGMLAWGQSERRACEQVRSRTGLQVRYDDGCQARGWDGQWQHISPR
jgi:hypothetical protein